MRGMDCASGKKHIPTDMKRILNKENRMNGLKNEEKQNEEDIIE